MGVNDRLWPLVGGGTLNLFFFLLLLSTPLFCAATAIDRQNRSMGSISWSFSDRFLDIILVYFRFSFFVALKRVRKGCSEFLLSALIAFFPVVNCLIDGKLLFEYLRHY